MLRTNSSGWLLRHGRCLERCSLGSAESARTHALVNGRRMVDRATGTRVSHGVTRQVGWRGEMVLPCHAIAVATGRGTFGPATGAPVTVQVESRETA